MLFMTNDQSSPEEDSHSDSLISGDEADDVASPHGSNSFNDACVPSDDRPSMSRSRSRSWSQDEATTSGAQPHSCPKLSIKMSARSVSNTPESQTVQTGTHQSLRMPDVLHRGASHRSRSLNVQMRVDHPRSRSLNTPQASKRRTCSADMRQRSCLQPVQSPLLGFWKLQSSENWDAFLKEAGVGLVMRKLFADLTQYEHITCAGEQFTIRILSAFKNFESTFSLDEEFEEENFDGKRVKVTASMDSSCKVLTIRQTAIETDGLALFIVREILSDDRMGETITCWKTGTTAKRYFIRTAEDDD